MASQHEREMNTRTIAAILRHTYGNDIQMLQQAEAGLEKLEKEPNFLPTLLQLVNEFSPNEDAVYVAAAIRLKNVVIKQWRGDSLSEKDKTYVKDHIFDALIPNRVMRIRSQILETMYHIIRVDYLHSWTGLLPKIMENIKTQDGMRVYAALDSLRMIFKHYRWQPVPRQFPGEEKVAEAPYIHQLVQQTFPNLMQIMNFLMTWNDYVRYDLIRLIVKMIYYSLARSIPPAFSETKDFDSWIKHLLQLIGLTVTPEHLTRWHAQRGLPQPPNPQNLMEEIGQQLPLVKCQKWAVRILHRLFEQYGRPRQVVSEYNAFAERWVGNYSHAVLIKMIEVLKNYVEGNFVPDSILVKVYSYLKLSVNFSQLYKTIKTNLDFLVYRASFKTLFLNQGDIELWQENPQEYIAKHHDIQYDAHSPRNAVREFIVELVRVRTRDTIEPIAKTLEEIFTKHKNGLAQDPVGLIGRAKEAAMNLLGALAPLLMQSDDYKHNLEETLVVHVCPELTSPTGFLRARACWTISRFYELKWRNAELRGQAVQQVLACLSFPEFPVKMEAAKAIGSLIINNDVIGFVRPHIPHVLEAFFHMTRELASESAMEVFDTLLDHFGVEIAPWADLICEHLQICFFKSLDDENSDPMTTTATSFTCLKTMNTVLLSCTDAPWIYPQLEAFLAKLVNVLLAPGFADYLEETLQIISSLVEYSPQLSDYAWSLLPRIADCYHNYGVDHFHLMVPILCAFIRRDPEKFATTKEPEYVEIVYAIVHTTYKVKGDEIFGVDDQEYYGREHMDFGSLLLENMLQHCKGKLDSWVSRLLSLVMLKLIQSKPEVELSNRHNLFNVIASLAYYNAPLFVAECAKQPQWTNYIFNQWLSHLPPHSFRMNWPQMKTSAIGLAAVCSVPVSDLSDDLKRGFTGVLGKLIDLVLMMNDDYLKYEKSPNADAQGFNPDDEPSMSRSSAVAMEDTNDDNDDGEENHANGLSRDSEAQYMQEAIKSGNPVLMGMAARYYENRTQRDTIEDVGEEQDFVNTRDEAYARLLDVATATGLPVHRLVDDYEEVRNLIPSAFDSSDECVVAYRTLEGFSNSQPKLFEELQKQIPKEKFETLTTHFKRATQESEEYQKRQVERKAKEEQERNERRRLFDAARADLERQKAQQQQLQAQSQQQQQQAAAGGGGRTGSVANDDNGGSRDMEQ